MTSLMYCRGATHMVWSRMSWRGLTAGAAVYRPSSQWVSDHARTMELGRSGRTLMMMLLLRPPAAQRGQLPGHRKQAPLKDQQFRWLRRSI